MAKVEFNPEASVIIVPAELENDGLSIYSYLVLDTGATYTMISWEIAKRLGLKIERVRKTVRFNTASGEVVAPLIKMDEISIMGVKAKNVEVIVHNLPVSARVDGLLGLSFLRNFNIQINFKEGILGLN